MEIPDDKGGMTKPVTYYLLQSLFRSKVDHPSYKTWKDNSESQREIWKDIQVSLLRVTDRRFGENYDKSDKFKSSKHIIRTTKLTDEKNKAYQRTLSRGGYINSRILKKLNKDQK